MKKGKIPNSGRKKGVPNKATSASREAIAKFIENNIDNFQDWLEQVAEKNPEKAFNMVVSILDYHIPKLSRQDTDVPVGATYVRMDNVTINGKELDWGVGRKVEK